LFVTNFGKILGRRRVLLLDIGSYDLLTGYANEGSEMFVCPKRLSLMALAKAGKVLPY
jgi:hypothetical protein